MNGRVFILIALAMVLVVGWYYFSQNDNTPSAALPMPDIHAEVSQINAIQTNAETGEIEYQLTAKSLQQNNAGQNELKQVVMHWTPTPKDSYTIKADMATLDETTGDALFGKKFVFIRHGNHERPDLVLSGDTLMGNIKSKQLHSQTPLDIKQGDNRFVARSMQVDLNVGDYHFEHIQISFAPPPRHDKPLF